MNGETANLDVLRVVPLVDDPLPVLPVDGWPARLRELVEATAEAYQVPADLPAGVVLASLAACVHGVAGVQVREGWVEQASLWVAVLLASGERKSPVFAAVTAPIASWERDEAARLAPAIRESESRDRMLKHRLAACEREAASARVDKRDAAEAARVAAVDALGDHRIVVAPRVRITDATPEALIGLYAQHGAVALLHDEGDVVGQMLGRYAKSGAPPALDAWLAGYGGEACRPVRASRDVKAVEHAHLTIGVTAQPAVADMARRDPSLRDRGALARFLWIHPASRVGRRCDEGPAVPRALIAWWGQLLTDLLTWREQFRNPEGGFRDFRYAVLSRGASAALSAHHDRWEARLREGADLAPIADWANKTRGNLVRVALLLHLAEHGPDGIDTPISAATMEAALSWADPLACHAARALGVTGIDGERLTPARRVWRWVIDRQRPGEPFTADEARAALRGTKSLATADMVRDALEVLRDHGHVDQMPDERDEGAPGRPRDLWHPTPAALRVSGVNA